MPARRIANNQQINTIIFENYRLSSEFFEFRHPWKMYRYKIWNIAMQNQLIPHERVTSFRLSKLLQDSHKVLARFSRGSRVSLTSSSHVEYTRSVFTLMPFLSLASKDEFYSSAVELTVRFQDLQIFLSQLSFWDFAFLPSTGFPSLYLY